MASDNNNNNSLSTLIIGLAAGAALGILFAPDKGSNTRARLKFKLARYKEQLKDLLEELETRKDAVMESEELSETKESAAELVAEVENLIKKIQSGKA
jgi:gas vesicle protein